MFWGRSAHSSSASRLWLTENNLKIVFLKILWVMFQILGKRKQKERNISQIIQELLLVMIIWFEKNYILISFGNQEVMSVSKNLLWQVNDQKRIKIIISNRIIDTKISLRMQWFDTRMGNKGNVSKDEWNLVISQHSRQIFLNNILFVRFILEWCFQWFSDIQFIVVNQVSQVMFKDFCNTVLVNRICQSEDDWNKRRMKTIVCWLRGFWNFSPPIFKCWLFDNTREALFWKI